MLACIAIRESHHPVALSLDVCLPALVVCFLVSMCVAVEFDDQPQLDAAEVYDVGADRMLASELQPVEPAVAEVTPEEVFGGCVFPPELSAAGDLLALSHGVPSP